MLLRGRAIANGLVVCEDIIEVARIGIDDDRSRRFLAMILDHGALILRRRHDPRVGCVGQQLAIAWRQIGVGRLIQCRLHASAEQKPGQNKCDSPSCHCCPFLRFSGAPNPAPTRA
jgi:hypothetical protein